MRKSTPIAVLTAKPPSTTRNNAYTARENSRAVLQTRNSYGHIEKAHFARHPLHHHRRRVLRLFQHLWAIPVLRIAGQFPVADLCTIAGGWVPFDPAGTSKASDGYSGNPARSERCYPAESLWHLRIAAVSVRLYDRYFSFQRSHHDRAAKFCTGPCYAVYLSAKPSTSHSYRSVCAGIGSCWCLPVGYQIPLKWCSLFRD